MADMYNRGNRALGLGEVAWGTDDVRVLLLKDDVGLTFDPTHASVADILAEAGNAECDDGSYARVTLTPADCSVSTDVANNEEEFDYDVAIDFGALTNEVVGAAILFRFVTDDSDHIPLAYLTSANFPFTTNGAGFTLTPSAEGLFKIGGAA